MTLSFRAERSALSAAVSMVAPIAAIRPHIVAAQGVLLVVEGDKLTLTATDLETTITTTISVTGLADGVAVVPARRLAQTVRALPDGAVTLAAEGQTVSLRCGSASFTLPTYAADEFPRLRTPTEGTAIDGPAFRAALEAVIPAASVDTQRTTICGVYLHANDEGRMVVVATDSYRLHRVILADQWEGDGAFLPTAALAHLAKLEPTDTILVTRLERGLAFTTGETVLTTTLIAAEYPTYESLLVTPSSSFTVDRGGLISAVKRVGLAVETDGPVRLVLSGDTLTLGGLADDGTVATDEVGEVEWDGPEITFGWRPRFALDALGIIADDRVEVRLTDSRKLMTFADSSDTLALVMPQKVD